MNELDDKHNFERSICKVLVTGGTGFMGSNFVRWVMANQPDAQVIVLDKLTYAGNLTNLVGLPEERLAFVQGDICDAQLVNSLIAEADIIVHFAAESHNDNSIAELLPFFAPI